MVRAKRQLRDMVAAWLSRVKKGIGGLAAVILLLGLGLFIVTLLFAIFGSTPVKPV